MNAITEKGARQAAKVGRHFFVAGRPGVRQGTAREAPWLGPAPRRWDRPWAKGRRVTNEREIAETVPAQAVPPKSVPARNVPPESVPVQRVPSQSELIELAVQNVLADGERVSVRRVYDRLRGRVSKHAVMEHLRTWRAG